MFLCPEVRLLPEAILSNVSNTLLARCARNVHDVAGQSPSESSCCSPLMRVSLSLSLSSLGPSSPLRSEICRTSS